MSTIDTTIDATIMYNWIVRLNSNPQPLNSEEMKVVSRCKYLKYIRKQSIKDNFTPQCVLEVQESFCEPDCICNTGLPSLIEINERTNFNIWFERLANKKELTSYERSIINKCLYLTDVRDHYEFFKFSPQSMMTIFRLRCDSSCICNNLPSLD